MITVAAIALSAMDSGGVYLLHGVDQVTNLSLNYFLSLKLDIADVVCLGDFRGIRFSSP